MAIVARYQDSSLGRWSHTEWRPVPGHPLAWAVDRVWDFDGMAAHPQERVFPNGMLELIVQLDDRYQDVTPRGLVTTPAACVTGIWSGPILVRAPRRRCRVLGVRLHPGGAWSLLSHPLAELADLTADLGDVVGRAAAELAEQCADAADGTERVRRTVAWLDRRLRRSAAPMADPTASRVAGRIAASRGQVSIATLRAEAALSDGRLVALFRQQVGVTPKRLARIHRFGHALSLLGQAPLAEVAVRAGYYDQPHMNADFGLMAGLTPGELLRATRYPNSTSLPEPIDS
jgi:AraC-like DNA-binding protein